MQRKNLALDHGAFVIAGCHLSDKNKHPLILVYEQLIPFRGYSLFANDISFGVDHYLYAKRGSRLCSIMGARTICSGFILLALHAWFGPGDYFENQPGLLPLFSGA